MSKELLAKYQDSIDRNIFPKYNHIVIDDVEESGASGYVDLVKESMNVLGIAHGGLYFTLADTVAGYSARADGREYVTQQSNFYFISSAKTGRIIAKGNVIKRTKSFCIVEVAVTDEKDNLLCKGSFNYYCINK